MQEKADDFSYKNGSINIQCPGGSAYYLIAFSNDGKVDMDFCFSRADSSELATGKTDSLTRTASFHISKQDMQTLDALVASMPTAKDGRRQLHDAFRYIVKIDGTSKIESNRDVRHIHAILKLLVPYFPKQEEEYDFYGYFSLFKAINN